jgi:hypothetical protein
MSDRERPAESLAREQQNPRCSLCGGPHPFDTTVPSVVWNEVIRAEGWPDYLCLTCVVTAFALFGQSGQSFTAELIGELFPGGLPIEVRINEQVARDSAKVSDENTTLRADLAALRQQHQALVEARAALEQAVEEWLIREGVIIVDAPRTRKSTHGSCCTCQTCGFLHDECCCDQNERTAAWRALLHGAKGDK